MPELFGDGPFPEKAWPKACLLWGKAELTKTTMATKGRYHAITGIITMFTSVMNYFLWIVHSMNRNYRIPPQSIESFTLYVGCTL